MRHDAGTVQHLPTRSYISKEGSHIVSCLIVTALQSRGAEKGKEKKETWLLDFVRKLYSYHAITSRSKYDWVFTGISTLPKKGGNTCQITVEHTRGSCNPRSVVPTKTMPSRRTQSPPRNADAIRMLDVVARDEKTDPIKARHET